MILLDTNVVIYASDGRSKLGRWSRRLIADAVSNEGAAINAVSLAEVCVGDCDPQTAADRIRSWGVSILDIPAAAAPLCAAAYQRYRLRCKADCGKDSSAVPLPDFFIGAHAQIMGWHLATADEGRFKTYFPHVTLLTPARS